MPRPYCGLARRICAAPLVDGAVTAASRLLANPSRVAIAGLIIFAVTAFSTGWNPPDPSCKNTGLETAGAGACVNVGSSTEVWASGVALGCLVTQLTFLMSGAKSPERLESVLVLIMAFTQMLIINVLLAGGLLSTACARTFGGSGSMVLLESPLRVVYRITGIVPIVSLLGRFCTRRDDRYVAAAVLASSVSLGVGGIGFFAPSTPLFALCAIITNGLNVFVVVRVWSFSNAAFAGMRRRARLRALAAFLPLVVAGWVAPPAIEIIYHLAGMSASTRRISLAAIDALLKVALSLVLLLGDSRLEEEVITRELSLLSQQRSAAESSNVAVKQFTRW